MNKIEVKNLSKSFGKKKVLQGINLSVPENKSIVLLGGSGSGKSVLIKNIIGLMKPDEGEVFIDGENIHEMSGNEIASVMSKCGFLFQGGALFDSLNIAQNIAFYPAKVHKLSEQSILELAASKLDAVGLSSDILKNYPAELSGGMQKRVALARAIAADPKIIFYDEPTTGLDPVMSNVINELIIKTKEELGATTFTITHDMNCLNMVADQVAMLYQGNIIWQGDKEEIKHSDNAILNQFISGSTKGPIKV